VLREERLERPEERGHVERAVGAGVPLRALVDGALEGVGERAGDDLLVDRVGDADRGVGGDEAEIADVEEIVVHYVRAEQRAREDGLDDPADPRVVELVHQRVQVGVSPVDQEVFRRLDVGLEDGLCAVGDDVLHDLPGQRVDEPRLPAGLLEGVADRLGLEGLARPGGVLRVQLGDLVPGEVAQREGVALDVEGRRRPERLTVRAHPDAVVVCNAYKSVRPEIRDGCK
jgi:hypothetical protein